MYTKGSIISILACFLLLFSSCKVTFTTTQRNKFEGRGFGCEKVQFYNNKYILLRRVLTSADVQPAKGKVKYIDGKKYEFIVIRKHTGGKAFQPEFGESKLYISFFPENEKETLFFRSDPNGNYYRIVDSMGNYLEQKEKGIPFMPMLFSRRKQSSGKVVFGNNEMDVIYGAEAILLFKKNQKYTEEATKRRAKGIKVE